MEAIKNALVWARKEGQNQSDLAKAIGVLPQDITNWKKRGMPAEWWPVVADLFHRSIDDLLGRPVTEGARPPESEQSSQAASWPFRSVSLERILALPEQDRIDLDENMSIWVSQAERRSPKKSKPSARNAA